MKKLKISLMLFFILILVGCSTAQEREVLVFPQIPTALINEYPDLSPEEFNTLRDLVISYFALVAYTYEVIDNNNGLVKWIQEQDRIFNSTHER